MNTLAWAIVAFLLFSFSIPETHAQQYTYTDSDTQEVTYDEIIRELNSIKKRNKQDFTRQTTYDKLQVHLGMGYLNSFSTFRIQQSLLQRYQNGMQLTLGMDLFDPSWYTEIAFRNFGVTNNGAEEIMLKEFDLKAAYIQSAKGPWKYFFTTGISNRFFHYREQTMGIVINNITPSWIVSTGLKLYANESFCVGTEIQGRTALVGATADVTSLDLAIKLETFL